MTMWFDREAGSPVAMGITDPASLMVGSGAPDWVRFPPELGGARVQVVEAFIAPCLKCTNHEVRHLAFDSDIGVAECNKHGFLWYRKSND